MLKLFTLLDVILKYIEQYKIFLKLLFYPDPNKPDGVLITLSNQLRQTIKVHQSVYLASGRFRFVAVD